MAGLLFKDPVICRLAGAVGMMFGSVPFQPEVLSGQINKRSSDLSGGKAEEPTHRVWFDFAKGTIKSHGSGLEHIIRLLPPSESGEVPNHPSCQLEQPLGSLGQEFPVSLVAAFRGEVQQSL